MGGDSIMQDADAVREENMMYGSSAMTKKELDEKYPNRPHNHSKTLPFHDIYLTLCDPLNDNKKKPTGPVSRKKLGPQGQQQSPHEVRRGIIDRFITRWRKEVGDDIYPAFRLIVPEKDRDRGMYGLKELTIGKLLIRIMKINKDSEDGRNLINWKVPGTKPSSVKAGDFPARCFEVISKRPMRTTPGDMTIAEVNELLDRLSAAQKEENQLPILEEFYNRMNAEELKWLICVILRQMKIGATEKTIFEVWHPDAENLFNISSSLRRVCWELHDPDVKLEGDDGGIALMQCFQPQLAAFQMRSMEQMVSRMRPTEDDSVFWIEEKLDGERMQMHMLEDDSVPGGKRFGFWSRKAKDYTYLYGNGFEDDNSALTRHLKNAFNEGVKNIILDGEMITWDLEQDSVVPFGSLKTAALAQQNNPYNSNERPLYRIFDCLYLNGKDLTRYTLRDRRKAMSASLTSVDARFEVHPYKEAHQASEIEPLLRRVVADAAEGLVLKNPRSPYRLNERNDDWIKVKPEYMTEFGESLDCVVIGGYYGSGKRGGAISSYLCGLRVDQAQIDKGENPMKCHSFFKVGGGFAASDYADIRHRTDGKWIDWNPKNPPNEYIALASKAGRLREVPDVWIKPCDSVVLSVKAASISNSDEFKEHITLRFPRFRKLRADKDWSQALSIQELLLLKCRVEEERQEKQFKIEDERRNKSTRKRKRETVILGNEKEAATPYAGPTTKVFEGMSFFIITEALKPKKMSKADLQQLVKANGGNIVASEKDPKTILVADRNLVKVASLVKSNQRNLVRPSWLFDCVKQSELDIGRPSLLLPFEPQDFFHLTSAEDGQYDSNVDTFGDSYTRDVTPDELLALFNKMPGDLGGRGSVVSTKVRDTASKLIENNADLDSVPGRMFSGLTFYCSSVSTQTIQLAKFCSAQIVDSLGNGKITHVLVSENSPELRNIRKAVSSLPRVPRIVTENWIKESWQEKTRLDEETFTPL